MPKCIELWKNKQKNSTKSNWKITSDSIKDSWCLQTHFHLYKSQYIASYNFLLLLLSSAYLDNSDIRSSSWSVWLIEIKDKCKIHYAKCFNTFFLNFFFVLGMQCLSCYGLELEPYLLWEQQRETYSYITAKLLARFLFLVWTALKLLWHMWRWNFANIHSFQFSIWTCRWKTCSYSTCTFYFGRVFLENTKFYIYVCIYTQIPNTALLIPGGLVLPLLQRNCVVVNLLSYSFLPA